ncbi:26S proteasome non-ATPase regulatory subunit 1-like [Sycon ciliatum]|uniref:26S proteasome non-ATPase regulatory subunit 1-like n=1 Tax=Sycon ciliatum TaxID=27933 RepID=UPI0020ACD72C|eukprot:scpid9907/ scgid11525/ 26S proteasome non-ATPase regulatory subunit 1; 26S proteasome regulatory subunit RPN2; 26S proteasome regulatory subunit S1
MAEGISSAGGLIALLSDEDPTIQVYALQRLNEVVDQHWTELSEHISLLEVLYENKSYEHRTLAALVVSKVYYHLGSFDDALVYALGAGDLFDVTTKSEYIETLVSKCVDKYTKYQATRPVQKIDDTVQHVDEDCDPRLIKVIDRLFDLCIERKKFNEAIGIALETRRLDVVHSCIVQAPDKHKTLNYCYRAAVGLPGSWNYKKDILKVLAPLFGDLASPDYLNMCHCYVFLQDYAGLAAMLQRLIAKKATDEITHLDRVTAYQVAFDLYHSTSQFFCTHVSSFLSSASAEEKGDSAVTMTTAETTAASGEAGSSTNDEHPPADVADPPDGYKEAMKKLTRILNGERTVELYLQFLVRSNHSDLLVYRHIKDHVRNSICHNAAIIANGFAHCGTTSDVFLREDIEWLGQAANWAKFTATASLGVIHKGHEKEALTLLSTYLPSESSMSAGYQDGGGLYALGLIHANHGRAVLEYLLKKLEDNKTNEVIQHGACLGLGLASLGARSPDVYEYLKQCLLRDDAVAGEAASMAMGLVMTGSLDAAILEEMIMYAQNTQHDKICNGLAVGIPMLMFNRQEEADKWIEMLTEGKDQHIRRTAMNCIAMAYCGTGNLKVVETLLHHAVSDAFGDVRRAAVTAIGFVLCNDPEMCPDMVRLLAESFNPYVRCGTAMALGIACAGTGNLNAFKVIEPLFKDSTNFVRQGAYIAGAMIMVAQSQGHNTKVAGFRALLRSTVADSHEESISKFGAIMAQGIIDAGGRNCTIQLVDKSGHLHMPSVVGCMTFQNFWYWFPVSHFLSLAFTPATVTVLNEDLEMPTMQLESWAKPPTYAYPPVMEVAKAKEKEKVKTAVLSTTAKVQAREARKAGQKGGKATTPTASTAPEPMETSEETETKPKEEEEVLPPRIKVENPARVVPEQLSVMKFEYESRYRHIKLLGHGGIIMAADSTRGKAEDLVTPAIDGPEPDPPEPFEWKED